MEDDDELYDYGEDEWDYDYDDSDESNEPIGSCDECECDLYEEDCYEHDGLQFCGQCYWHATGGAG